MPVLKLSLCFSYLMPHLFMCLTHHRYAGEWSGYARRLAELFPVNGSKRAIEITVRKIYLQIELLLEKTWKV